MSLVNTLMLTDSGYPELLRNIPAPPKQLYFIGAEPDDWLDAPRVAIVGSRKISSYGTAMTRRIANGIAEQGVIVISGLAYGVDAAAHQATLDVGGITVAVLAGGLDAIYPAYNADLARQILANKGSLLSEYPAGMPSLKQNFVARNRIVSGLADVLVITEATINSGTLHTAKFALDQGKTVMAVPGNVTSPNSEGTNNLIKSGALPVTDASDVLFALKLNQPKKIEKRPFIGTQKESTVLGLIAEGVHSQEDLVLASRLDSSEFSSVLTMLEISGYIRPLGAGVWDLA
jgi:DNA processing protein